MLYNIMNQHNVKAVILTERTLGQKIGTSQVPIQLTVSKKLSGIVYLVWSYIHTGNRTASLDKRHKIASLATAYLQHPRSRGYLHVRGKIVDIILLRSLGQFKEITFSISISAHTRKFCPSPRRLRGVVANLKKSAENLRKSKPYNIFVISK